MTEIAVMSPPSAAPRLAPEDVRALLAAVQDTTERLRETHESLHREVARLQAELAEANAQLRRSRSLAALGEMAAGIAHEVRNPLASIGLYAQALGDDLADRPEGRSLCGKIREAVVGIDAIVRDVLAFAREPSIRPAPVELARLVERSVAACDGVVRPAGATVEIRIDAGAPEEIAADAVLLGQAIQNVVRNAAEAMHETEPGERRIDVVVAPHRLRGERGRRVRGVEIACRDRGPGIRPEIVERMFNPFFTTRPTGTGLGLAIVHRIVEAHGGAVAVRNAEDGGAIVALRLPERAAGGGAGERDARGSRAGRDVRTASRRTMAHENAGSTE